MAVAAAGPVLTFNPKENEWEVFFKRLEQYFIVHGVTEEADKRAHLLYSLSEEAYILLENLCMPQKPEETPYQDIVQLLSNYYGKTAVVWVERQKFYSASKSGNETALEWSVRLKGLARYCNFGQQLESKLTDIFVTQFNPGKVRTELFSLNENTTLNNAVEKAKIIEATLVIRDPVGEVKSEVLESDVFRITQNNSNVGATGDQHQDPQRYHRGTAVPAAQRSQGGTRRSGGNSSNMALPQLQPFTSSGRSPGCFRCGRNHNSNVCPYKEYICNSCHGSITYYNRFIRNLPDILHPLYNLLKKDVSWSWDKTCQDSFEYIKLALCSDDVLVHYNPDLPVTLTIDSSDYGVGAILSHVFENDVEKPICYASRTLSKNELAYSILDKEATAIVWSIKRFYQYLWGRKFTLVTDNKALMSIFEPKTGVPVMAANRLQRYAHFLSGFNFDIKHVSSIQNVADFLSRMPIEDDMSVQLIDFPIHLNYLTNSDSSIPVDVNKVRELTSSDSVLSEVLNFVKKGWPASHKSNELKPYFSRKNEINVEDDVLLWGHRVIIPFQLREVILKELHATHLGIVKMKYLARSYFWWPSLNDDIESVSRSLRTRFDMLRPSSVQDNEKVELENVYQNIQRSQRRNVKYFRGNRKVCFNIDQIVLVKDYRDKQVTWCKGQVVKILGKNVYVVRPLDSNFLWKRHTNQIRELNDDYSLVYPPCVELPHTVNVFSNSDGASNTSAGSSVDDVFVDAGIADSERVDVSDSDSSSIGEQAELTRPIRIRIFYNALVQLSFWLPARDNLKHQLEDSTGGQKWDQAGNQQYAAMYGVWPHFCIVRVSHREYLTHL
ncbi:unnamed protein product [Acanthoscelides obtectus]|uniref:RNA-directed DNA polymerase n=1 Tax=Acanthoscelides obtectus TaxID=200917 RepID=A0A9P0M2C7_ACAOB|nr:unnamed protein product [Acanthoscelides obtectus]CAK1677626.1 Transposon Tf2-6 polyprotein [Acanthoscelides obtectus]